MDADYPQSGVLIPRRFTALKVQEEVAAAVGHSVDAVESWLREWRKRDTESRINDVKAAAAAYALGEEIAQPVPDELLMVNFFASAKGGPLQALAKNWIDAAKPRKATDAENDGLRF